MKPNTRGQAFIGVSISLTVVTTVLIAARLYTRHRIVRRLGWDDAMIFNSWLFSTFVCGLFTAEVFLGLGQHSNDVSPENLKQMLLVFYVNILLYNVSLSSTKLSLALQYLNVSTTRPMRIACYLLMFAILGFFIATIFASAFICTPMQKFWDFELPGKCLSLKTLWLSFSSFNIATDVAIYVLPMKVLSGLQIPKKKKNWLRGVFGLGGFVVLISSLRLYSLYVAVNSEDVVWDNLPAGVWSDLEMRLALICASVPALYPLLCRIYPRAFVESESDSQPEGKPSFVKTDVSETLHDYSIGAYSGLHDPVSTEELGRMDSRPGAEPEEKLG